MRGARLTANITVHLHFNENDVDRSFNFPPSSRLCDAVEVSKGYLTVHSGPVFPFPFHEQHVDAPCEGSAWTLVVQVTKVLEVRKRYLAPDIREQYRVYDGHDRHPRIDGTTYGKLATINTKGVGYNAFEQCRKRPVNWVSGFDVTAVEGKGRLKLNIAGINSETLLLGYQLATAVWEFGNHCECTGIHLLGRLVNKAEDRRD